MSAVRITFFVKPSTPMKGNNLFYFSLLISYILFILFQSSIKIFLLHFLVILVSWKQNAEHIIKASRYFVIIFIFSELNILVAIFADFFHLFLSWCSHEIKVF